LKDPDADALPGETIKVLKTEPITVEENRTRREENKLRTEHRIPLRKLPY
jgi:hypothetical protein